MIPFTSNFGSPSHSGPLCLTVRHLWYDSCMTRDPQRFVVADRYLSNNAAVLALIDTNTSIRFCLTTEETTAHISEYQQ